MMTGWIAALTLATSAGADTPAPAYSSCDLDAQHALAPQVGGTISDPRQARISTRADILQADLGTARTARRLRQREADRLWARVQHVRDEADRFTREQGFLSAGETASYDRMLDAVARQLCRRT